MVGRHLAGQQVDPRINQIVSGDIPDLDIPIFMEGNSYILKKKKPSEDLVEHLRSCSINSQPVLNFLTKLGISRIELSNALQGVQISNNNTMQYTLHIPSVPISIARNCPGINEDFNMDTECDPELCNLEPVHWNHPDFPYHVYRKNNCLYYTNINFQQTIIKNSNIDRLVIHPTII